MYSLLHMWTKVSLQTNQALTQEGMYNELLEQQEENQGYLDAFLQKSNTPWLAWIQDIHAGRFHDAYVNLMAVTDKEPVIEKKKVNLIMLDMCLLVKLALRLSKLCFIAHHQSANDSMAYQNTLDGMVCSQSSLLYQILRESWNTSIFTH